MLVLLLLSRERSSFQRSCVFPFPHHPQLQLHLAYCSFPWEALPLIFSQLVWVYAKSLQSCLTLCNPMNCSLPGSSVHRILQARILEWVAIPFSSGSSWPRDWTQASCIAGRFFTIWATTEAPQLTSRSQEGQETDSPVELPLDDSTVNAWFSPMRPIKFLASETIR